MHLRDYWLRDRLNFRHELGADVKDAPVVIDVAIDHFAQIMARAVHFAVCRQDDCADVRVFGKLVEAAYQLEHQFEREGVAAIGPIEGYYPEVALSRPQQIPIRHGGGS